MINKISKYIIKHTNPIIDSVFFLVVIAVAIPFYNLFLNVMNLYMDLIINAAKNGMSDTFQLVFICGFIYFIILIFGLILKGATYMQEQTKSVANGINRPRKKKN